MSERATKLERPYVPLIVHELRPEDGGRASLIYEVDAQGREAVHLEPGHCFREGLLMVIGLHLRSSATQQEDQNPPLTAHFPSQHDKNTACITPMWE